MGRFRLQSTILGILICLVCVAVLLRQVDLKHSSNALGHLNGPSFLVPLTVLCATLLLRAWRWQLIFPASSRPTFASCLIVLGIGNMANFLLPGRAGDLARCVLTGSGGSLYEGSRTLATLAIEKVLDGLGLVGIVLFSVSMMHSPSWVLMLVRVSSLIFGTALVLLVFLRYKTRAFVGLVLRASRRVRLASVEGRLDVLLTSFADGLTAVSPERLLILLWLTATIWIAEGTSIWGLAQVLRISVGFKSATVASAILGLGLMVPAAPGGLGTYELFGTEAFKLTGLSSSSALALTIVIHAWVFVTNVLAGVILLSIKGIGLAQLRRRLTTSESSLGALGSKAE